MATLVPSVTCPECEGGGRVSIPPKPCECCQGKGRVQLNPYDPKRANMESDSDLIEAALLQELATARGTLMTLQSLLDRGAFQAAKELIEKTLADMRPVNLRR